MDIFDEEIIKFWKAMEDNNVRFIMVGGYATNIHGFQRYTADMDIWMEDNLQNRINLRKAFKEAGMGDYFMLETLKFIPGFTDFRLNNGLRLDIMTNMKGLEGYSFDACYKMATIAEIENIQIPFLHLNHLVENKKAVNRPKDQIDVIELEKVVALRKEMGLD